MCIRDRANLVLAAWHHPIELRTQITEPDALTAVHRVAVFSCLLYTSDAADERSSVDLGGRRIIKKKRNRAVITNKTYHITYSKDERTS